MSSGLCRAPGREVAPPPHMPLQGVTLGSPPDWQSFFLSYLGHLADQCVGTLQKGEGKLEEAGKAEDHGRRH
jgi:hypothetical protein